MTRSYEKEMQEASTDKLSLTKKIDFSMMKYLWMANPLGSARKHSIPKFLRNVELLKNFSDNELRILAKYMHSRKFSEDEIVFRAGEIGIGFYFIYSGTIELSYDDIESEVNSEKFLILEEFGYFGELALLQEGNLRTATALAKNKCELVGIFKPDLDNLILRHPIIAAKLIQSISIALADRLYYLTYEASRMAKRLKKLEAKNDSQ
ncbi:MAG: cyclic nucleotide-binding domain-containing protein [Bacteriovorax sp.]|jgi:CRP/FNR family cyclic AMP-dependent transcriptional regulator|nr:cyclic nucleotide-binding domain-containing protein [Bacteriovorax sp.]